MAYFDDEYGELWWVKKENNNSDLNVSTTFWI